MKNEESLKIVKEFSRIPISFIALLRKKKKTITHVHQGLLDRHEFLSWVVEEMSQIRMYDVYALSNFSSFILMYNNEVLQNQLLARKFMFAACHHLRWIFAEDNSSVLILLFSFSIKFLFVIFDYVSM